MINSFTGQYEFLSNFAHSPFVIEEIEYPTNEHFFQAMKMLELDERKAIAAAATPSEAKRMGRKIKLRDDWEQVKDSIMLIGLWAKFKRPEMRAQLLLTGEEELVEGNSWHNRTWGRCNCATCQGQGENRLGKMLMQIRTEIREELNSY